MTRVLDQCGQSGSLVQTGAPGAGPRHHSRGVQSYKDSWTLMTLMTPGLRPLANISDGQCPGPGIGPPRQLVISHYRGVET